MNLDYADIFAARGHLYHRAMIASPDARDAEFQRLFDCCPVLPGATLLDLPSGGGYLASKLPEGVAVTTRELTPGFGPAVQVVDADDWKLGKFDHIVCLAALHHIEDQPAFLARLCSHLASSGTLHFADVAAGSPHAEFLDGFVGRYNETGHDGRYLDRQALPLQPDPAFTVTRVDDVSCPWRFTSDDHMLAFCNDLFGLVDCPRSELSEVLHDTIGVRHVADSVLLDWRLVYVDVSST